MSLFLAEFIGTALLMVFGCGVVANVVLAQTKGSGGGWIVITWGWGMGVFVAVFTVSQFSGAHINPAVTFGLATAGLFDWALVPMYIAAQMVGAAFGAFLVWLAYRDHFAATADPDLKLAVFCTAPNIRRYPSNVITEVIGTIVLVVGVLFLAEPGFVLVESGEFLQEITLNGETVGFGLGSLAALPVALLVLGIGLSLGGPTGYAINPARDLGPRIAHALLPIPGKRDSDWSYSWVPVIGPLVGGTVAGLLFLFLL